MVMLRALLLSAALAFGGSPAAPAEPELLVGIDWQAHPAMHIPWKIFRKGLLDRQPRLSHRHQFRQTLYSPYLEQSGVRLFLAAAMAAERSRNPEHARALILEQIAYVEDFVAEHPDRFAIGRSPDQVRTLLRETDKIVILHAIEGGHDLLHDRSDAAFWAAQGVVLVTLIHLRDDELGSAGILPTAIGPIINRRGAKRRRQGERRGLTPRGEQTIVELDAAGILVDLSHMTQASIDDALAVTAAHDISPVVTHGKLAAIRDTELSQRDDQVLEIYRQGGVFSLGLSGAMLDPINPVRPISDDVCRGTLEMFRAHHEAVTSLLAAHAHELVGADGPLTAAQRTRLAVGWSSDWNGWLSHSKPVYGAGRCRGRAELSALEDPLEIDTRGLAHPGMLPQHWKRLERDGMDLEPMLRSAERFLQLWANARRED
jgi:microsomal dipeptidase-like Zn-dependent dipeptidase